MSFEQYHLNLGKDALSNYILEMQLILHNGLRLLATTVEHPNAMMLSNRLIGQTHNLICKTHAEYVLGQGPVARRMLDLMVKQYPNQERSSIFEEAIKPLLPQYKTLDESERDKDRSTNRHWATMVRVAFGADKSNRWNHDILDKWCNEGKIQTVKDFAQDKDQANTPGANLLRIDAGESHVYCVRVMTREYNKNMLTLTETIPSIDAAVYVELEDIWATHDDCGLISDQEIEGYIETLLKHYGVFETPLPVIEDKEPEAVVDPQE